VCYPGSCRVCRVQRLYGDSAHIVSANPAGYSVREITVFHQIRRRIAPQTVRLFAFAVPQEALKTTADFAPAARLEAIRAAAGVALAFRRETFVTAALAAVVAGSAGAGQLAAVAAADTVRFLQPLAFAADIGDIGENNVGYLDRVAFVASDDKEVTVRRRCYVRGGLERKREELPLICDSCAFKRGGKASLGN
jgi:hypothetical protein